MNNFWCNFLPVIVGLGGAWIGGLIGWYMRRSRIAELETVVDDKEAENLHLKNNNEMMGIRLENFQNEYTRASANLNTLEAKHNALQNKYAVLETTNRVLSSQVEEINTKTNTVAVDNTMEIALKQPQIDILNTNFATVQSALAEKENRVFELENQISELQQAQALLLKEYERHNNGALVLEDADGILDDEISTKYKELEQSHILLLAEHEKRSNHIASVYASKEEWRQAFIEAENKIDAYDQQIVELKALNDELEQAFHDMSQKYHSLSEEIEGLTVKNKQWEASYSQLDSENVALVAKSKDEPNNTVVHTLDENTKQELIYLQDAKAQLEITRIKLENDLEILRGHYEELSQKSSAVGTSDLNNLEAQNQQLIQDIETIKAEAAAKEDTHKISSNLWQKRYTNILNEIDDYKVQLANLKSIEAQYNEKAKEWEMMYDELVVSYQESHKACQVLLEKNNHYEDKINELEQTTLIYTGTIAPEPEFIDDLKIVEGIGPKIEDVLKKAGILTFEQLSQTPADKISAILEEAGSQFKMHDPSTWSTQADLAAKQEWEKLKAYQDYLLGGRDTSVN
jgi:predicted flap endonuclease-1-like 5' DNA nuclease/predicted  nucleic acid-binding Zn-ribbon protein